MPATVPTTPAAADVRYYFVPNDKGSPAGKLADAEMHFTTGPLAGLKLVGFGVWTRKNGGRMITYPARQYSVNGERRSYALLRPIVEQSAQDALSTAMLAAFVEWEADRAATRNPGRESARPVSGAHTMPLLWTDPKPVTVTRHDSPAFVHLVAFAIIAGCLLSFALASVL